VGVYENEQGAPFTGYMFDLVATSPESFTSEIIIESEPERITGVVFEVRNQATGAYLGAFSAMPANDPRPNPSKRLRFLTNSTQLITYRVAVSQQTPIVDSPDYEVKIFAFPSPNVNGEVELL
jgi:hypothetical protein